MDSSSACTDASHAAVAAADVASSSPHGGADSGAPLDTTSLNGSRHDFSGVESVWLFGYGSLIYKVDFPFLERRPAKIHGWVRRLWQGSHDHRGTAQHPGRVATLVAAQGAQCVGMAYRVAPATFRHLDFREKNGYLRIATTLEFGEGESAEGLVYIATADNAAWLGPADEAEIARHVSRSSGPSGSNRDYVLALARALRQLGAADPHVFAVEAHLRSLSNLREDAGELHAERGHADRSG